MELHTDRCTLRPFRPADAASVAHHADDRKDDEVLDQHLYAAVRPWGSGKGSW
jgi:hypothetical protein